ncbi:unnamed protein product [Didymodactylos carnosus]|uniref:Uncharacterized protein n=1 Tax=Didymodactylos carnosus TaxID=1234261 RepID=A0A813TM39_9BILA|nr:unnamed protein product [Didymodactylos carnosus]CAF0915573.1 unnamed protein product [Didymodactylos carnosus]CAF3597327.1 unnamed protein product [Didymodactylos carnosus]CAF3693899.1 unnamed protein product [Didymodactylos carnosus]
MNLANSKSIYNGDDNSENNTNESTTSQQNNEQTATESTVPTITIEQDDIVEDGENQYPGDNEFDSDNSEEFDDEDQDSEDDSSFIDRHHLGKIQLQRSCSAARETELKSPLNIISDLTNISSPLNRCYIRCMKRLIQQRSSLRHSASDSDVSKPQQQPIILSISTTSILPITSIKRIYLPLNLVEYLKQKILDWLSNISVTINMIIAECLIKQDWLNKIKCHCWVRLLLTYLIEFKIELDFLNCSTLVSDGFSNEHRCVPETDGLYLKSILQKGYRLNVNSQIMENIRRIIVIKTIQEACHCETVELHDVYVKELKTLKHQSTEPTLYSKILLFLSSLYSVKVETIHTLLCQHLRSDQQFCYLFD